MTPGPDDRRRDLLRRLEDALELPMVVLGFVWLGLLVLELAVGLTPGLEWAATAIWIVFAVDFALKLILAPARSAYLRANWLTVLALVLPALRVFRLFRVVRLLRAARAARGVRMVRLVTSVNRGIRALRRAMGRRGFGYVIALTAVVTFAGAAGIYAFEQDRPGGPVFGGYGDALWWTAMIMATMGTDYWPVTPEGRILCFLLALYAFAVFGYVTAFLAAFLLGRDAVQSAKTGDRRVDELLGEIRALREDLRNRRDRGTGM